MLTTKTNLRKSVEEIKVLCANCQKTGVIYENEINLIKRRLNNFNIDLYKEIETPIQELSAVALSPEYNDKLLKLLRKAAVAPTGEPSKKFKFNTHECEAIHSPNAWIDFDFFRSDKYFLSFSPVFMLHANDKYMTFALNKNRTIEVMIRIY